MKREKNPNRISDELQQEFDELDRELRKSHYYRDLYLEDPAQLLAYAERDTNFLFENVLPTAGVGFIVGKSESGKSWLAYDLCLAIARQRPWLIFRNAMKKPGTVLVLNYDNPPQELARRFLRMGLKPEDKIFFHQLAVERDLPKGFPPLLRLPMCEEPLLAMVSTLKPALILVDSLRQAHTLREGDAMDMGQITACLRQLTMYGSTVLVIHHYRKAQKDGRKAPPVELEDPADDEEMRGSTELTASADVTLHTRASPKQLMTETSGTLFVGKTRGFIPALKQCGFSIRDDSSKNTTVVPGGRLDKVIEAVNAYGPITRRDLARKVSGLEPKQLTVLVNLCIDFGRIREVQRPGQTRELVPADFGGGKRKVGRPAKRKDSK